MHKISKYPRLLLCFMLCNFGTALGQVNSLSTSNLIPISEKNSSGVIISACSGKKAVTGLSYVTIASAKQTVNRNDNLFRRLVDSNRKVFTTHTLAAKYQSADYSFSRVSNPFSLTGANSSVDINAQWVLLNQIPWVLRNTNLKIKLGYSADATTDSLAEAFSSVTTSMPSFSLSASAATGIAVTNAVDKLLFGPGRSENLLDVSLEFPLGGDSLCDGYYAAFAANNKTTYEKYNSSTVVWSGNDLQYKNTAISDVSYSVFRVRVEDKIFPNQTAAFSDTSRSWVKPYQSALDGVLDLTHVIDSAVTTEKRDNILSQLILGRNLLSGDRDILPFEQREIHEFVSKQVLAALENLKKRISLNGTITLETTRETVKSALVNRSVLVSETSANIAENSLDTPVSFVIAPTSKLPATLKTSIDQIERTVKSEF